MHVIHAINGHGFGRRMHDPPVEKKTPGFCPSQHPLALCARLTIIARSYAGRKRSAAVFVASGCEILTEGWTQSPDSRRRCRRLRHVIYDAAERLGPEERFAQFGIQTVRVQQEART